MSERPWVRPDGTFDMAAWKAAGAPVFPNGLPEFETALRDGTISAHHIIDEPDPAA